MHTSHSHLYTICDKCTPNANRQPLKSVKFKNSDYVLKICHVLYRHYVAFACVVCVGHEWMCFSLASLFFVWLRSIVTILITMYCNGFFLTKTHLNIHIYFILVVQRILNAFIMWYASCSRLAAHHISINFSGLCVCVCYSNHYIIFRQVLNSIFCTASHVRWHTSNHNIAFVATIFIHLPTKCFHCCRSFGIYFVLLFSFWNKRIKCNIFCHGRIFAVEFVGGKKINRLFCYLLWSKINWKVSRKSSAILFAWSVILFFISLPFNLLENMVFVIGFLFLYERKRKLRIGWEKEFTK